jgi:adenylate cyclase class IV
VLEHELKAVVPDPDAVLDRLRRAGAEPGFRGIMTDVRFDRDGELLARDEVLRLRSRRHSDGTREDVLGWKGPTGVSPQGYKIRRELEYDIRGSGGSPGELLRALGYREAMTIERYVEYWTLGPTVFRLEWYPRMDVLLEIEGPPDAIERGILVSGLPRDRFSAEPLAGFVARYAARTGLVAVLDSAGLGGAPPTGMDR